MDFNPEQQAAIAGLREFLDRDNKEGWIGLYGFAGTGKSTVVAEALRGFQGTVGLSAPTHKAVSVLRRIAQNSDLFEDRDIALVMRTIHSLLRLRKKYDSGRTYYLPDLSRDPPVAFVDVLVLDECSMASADMMDILRQAQTHFGFKVIVMGDPYQLKPVDDGGKMSQSFDVAGYELTEVMRNGGVIGEAIAGIRDHLIDHNYNYASPGSDDRGEVVHHFMVDDFFEAYMSVLGEGYDLSEKAKMIAYTNRKVDDLNDRVRKRLFGENVEPFIKGEYMVAKEAYSVDDEMVLYTEQVFKVVSAKRAQHMGLNCWRLEFDGPRGVTQIVTLDPSQIGAYEQKLAILRESALINKRWKPFYKLKEAFAMIRPPYATTVHKSQGSTYEHCFVDESEIKSKTWGDMDARGRLLYVAYSRASKSLHLHT